MYTLSEHMRTEDVVQTTPKTSGLEPVSDLVLMYHLINPLNLIDCLVEQTLQTNAGFPDVSRDTKFVRLKSEHSKVVLNNLYKYLKINEARDHADVQDMMLSDCV